jgi:kinesin family member 5
VLLFRCIERLLQKGSEANCEVYASYLQIYCETITDLLWQTSNNINDPDFNGNPTAGASFGAGGNTASLALRDKGDGSGVFVDGLSRYKLTSSEDLAELLSRGDSLRATASTNMNETSSRSHAVLILKIILKDDVTTAAIGPPPPSSSSSSSSSSSGASGNVLPVSYKESMLMLVDLAGSERAHASEGKHAARLEEAKAINLSLSALGNCMSALAAASSSSSSSSAAVHIPYRDSKLTRLLQGCLGGGARTAIGKLVR